MYDPRCMCKAQGVADLPDVVEHLVDAESPSPQQLGKVGAINILHHEEKMPLSGRTEVMNCHDVRML